MTENGFQLFKLQRRGDAEHAAIAIKTPVRHQDVTVWIDSEEIAESLDSNDGAGDGNVFMNRILEKDLQGFPGRAAQIGKKLPVIEKITAEDLGNTKDEVPVGGIFLMTSMQSHSPNSTTLFWWQDGQKCLLLHEKARRYSWPQSLHFTRAKPLCRSPQSR